MTDRYARYGAATGILFVVLVVITFATLPKPPSSCLLYTSPSPRDS